MPPYQGGYQTQPPYWQPPPPPAPEKRDDVTAEGIPLSSRGGFVIDTASYAAGDTGVGAVSLFLQGSIPIQGKTFIDGRVPVAFVSQPILMGNVSIGAHHVFRLGDGAWFTLGGNLGFPTSRGDVIFNDAAPTVALTPRALWDMGDYWPDSVPIKLSTAIEGHVGIVTLRGFLDVLVMPGFGDNDEHELAIPHAFEVQFGHRIGGGLRIQGVAIPTADNYGIVDDLDDDLYQFAFEPFFSYEADLVFVRSGLVIPVDGHLGPPFATGWGFKLATGVRVD